MRSPELTDKVIAFSRTLRLRGKKEEKRQEVETEEGETSMEEQEVPGHEEGGGGRQSYPMCKIFTRT